MLETDNLIRIVQSNKTQTVSIGGRWSSLFLDFINVITRRRYRMGVGIGWV